MFKMGENVMELIQVGKRTYYIKNVTNIGIYKIDDENIYLIDTGKDQDAGKKILKIIEAQGWKVRGIINTHSNADHIGGNCVIQNRTGCLVLAHKIEKIFIHYPILEPSFLYGGYPFQKLRNKFLLAKESKALEIEENLPEGLEFISLRGHFFDMIGIKTSDDIYFLADSIFSEETISKYHFFFLYDVKEFLSTLDYLGTLKGKFYILSHIEGTEDITSLIELNRRKVHEILEQIWQACHEGKTFEQILKYVFDEYHLIMNENQYVLVGSTIRSYLAYLCDEGQLDYEFQNNQMIWKQSVSILGGKK